MRRNLIPSVLFLALFVVGSAGCGSSNQSASATTRPSGSSGAAVGVSAQASRELAERVAPSLVAVQYVWETELGRRELVGPGIVVGPEGLVMMSIATVDQRIPDEQMKDFKIIVPRFDRDPEELDAVFQGRDERTNLAFVKTKEPQNWTPVTFKDLPYAVGDPVLSVGLLPKDAGYKSYLMQARIAAQLRGEVPQVMTSGGLAAVGSPVFNAKGQAIGFVNYQSEQSAFLNLNDPRNPLSSVTEPPIFFVPTRDFIGGIKSPPVAGQPERYPWIGIPQQAMTGLNKDVAEELGLKDQPAIELGDIIKGTPADKAGLKSGDVIVRVNGEPLERGDAPEELPMILVRKLRRLNVGDEVTLSLLRGGKGDELTDVKLTLEERPKMPNLAERYYAEDLGFSVRELVFVDRYQRRLKDDAKGVVVALIKPQSSAQSAKLGMNDLIVEMNGEPVSSVEDFKKQYEAMRKEKPKEPVVLVVQRESNTQVIRIEPPQ
ncbi:MAG TPA: PDZ domain-containing protein [Tepidisphaeraceae bacterium]|nr:PDZ domain-containing protein [Tepidisphaeraceae bacterium]